MKTFLLKINITNFLHAFILQLLLFVFTLPINIYSQENIPTGYRNINSYLKDFAKNELFVKKSLIEYSSSIIENQAITRSGVSSVRIVEKLKKINIILRRFDKGFQKNTTLRDSFIKMNEKTIECMTNGTLILNDYELQSSKKLSDIALNLKQREVNLISYFDELERYEQSKRDFGLLFNINIRNYSGYNLFEYNANQNILFYKTNVIDQKMLVAITCINKEDFNDCIAALENVYDEVVTKTSDYKNEYKDVSLNEENRVYSKFIYDQKEVITPLFNDFIKDYESLQLLKELKTPETTPSIALYNKTVRSYNLSKNKLFELLKKLQENKTVMYNNWFIVNRAFLKNNVKLDDIYESYVAVN